MIVRGNWNSVAIMKMKKYFGKRRSLWFFVKLIYFWNWFCFHAKKVFGQKNLSLAPIRLWTGITVWKNEKFGLTKKFGKSICYKTLQWKSWFHGIFVKNLWDQNFVISALWGWVSQFGKTKELFSYIWEIIRDINFEFLPISGYLQTTWFHEIFSKIVTYESMSP